VKQATGLASVMLAVGLVAAAPARAAVNAYLKIDGIPGESADDKHKDEIELLSYRQGAPPSTTARAARAGAVSMSEITITKTIDKSSPKLMEACATGKHFPTATVTVRYMKYELHDVVITSYRAGGGGTETVVLHYGSMQQIPVIASPSRLGPGSQAPNKALIRHP
jgi:type VI secretion system secreted protein Hcp